MSYEGNGYHPHLSQEDQEEKDKYEDDARRGSASAQYQIGKIYAQYQNLAANRKQVIHWYGQAAHQGHLEAQTQLANLYAQSFQELFFPPYKKAAYWYEKAAQQGRAEAQVAMGRMYYEGWGVPQDYQKTIYWWKKAARQNHEGLAWTLGQMYYKGYPRVRQDYKEALYWFEKSLGQSKNSYTNKCLLMVADIYYNGPPEIQDYKKAKSYYEELARPRYPKSRYNAESWGNPEAQYHLATMYENGHGTAQDLNKALAWHRKAAHHGYVLSLNYMVKALAQGIGTPPNLPVAYGYLLELTAQEPGGEHQEAGAYLLSQLSPGQIEEAYAIRKKISDDRSEIYAQY